MPLQPFRDLGTLDGGRAAAGAANDLQRNQLLNLSNQQRQAGLDEFGLNAPVREAQRGTALDDAALQSIVAGAIEVKPLLDAGDINGAINSLTQRRSILEQRGTPTTQTDEALSLLLSGDPEKIGQVKQVVDGIVGKAQGGLEFGQPFSGLDAEGNPSQFRGAKTGEIMNTGIPPLPSDAKSKEDARERRIQDFMTTLKNEDGTSISREQAVKLDSGFRKFVTDTLGQQSITDVVQEKSIPILKEQPDLTQVLTPQEQTIFDSANEGTGIWNAITRGVAATLLPLGAGVDFAADEIRAKQTLESETRNMTRAFALSDNYAVREQERITEQIGLLPSLTEDPKAFKERAISIEGFVARSIDRKSVV